MHVPDRIQMDQRGDTGDEQDHRDRQRIGQKAEVDVEVAGDDPREELEFDDALIAFETDHAGKYHERGDE